ncbi:iron ABC transporter permease [Acuticoccus sp. M5D2P5]|uniref:FecCD family ABC transporter permease n=1 Tax=Acuticoccus kalidii TaxID=2910977 RepID=UPI001F3CF38A|nr:iron ABC transporter permease [Acuticoccus kalidii]MCF3934004.1 iron ABC transporter permease [Acuticoccus kalidii]
MMAFVVLAASIAALFGASVAIGDEPIAIAEIARVLLGEGDPVASFIVEEVRLPRAILAVLVGAALGTGGAIAQAVMRNPLAEPGILGINGGAALAALIVIVEIESPPARLLPLAAFAGALITAAAIYALAWNDGTSSLRIILVGLGLNALAGAGVGFISAFGDVTTVQQAQVWLAGSLYRADWETVRVLAVWLVLPVVGVLLAARELDVLTLGADAARALGQRVEPTSAAMILAMALISAAAVAAAGLIGFVGLIAPHLARRIGGRRSRHVLPLAALSGAALVLAADLVGRLALSPANLPAGIVTTLIGAPFFALLLWRRRDAV